MDEPEPGGRPDWVHSEKQESVYTPTWVLIAGGVLAVVGLLLIVALVIWPPLG